MAAQSIAKYGEWKSTITSDFLIKGNCKSICELQVGGGRVFWTEQTFPAGTRVLYEFGGSGGAPVQWSPDGVSVSTSVHEYGGGSFYISDSEPSLIISHKGGGIYNLTGPKEARTVVEYPPEKDTRHADFFTHGHHLYAVQERHDTGGEPQNLLVHVDTRSGEVKTVAEGADFYAEPRVSPDGKRLAWIQWNKPNMPWDETSLYVAELGDEGMPISPRELMHGNSCFGLQWSPAEPLVLHVISDTTGFWNVYALDVSTGNIKENLFPVSGVDIGGPLWVFADDRPFAVSKSHVVIAVDGQLWCKRTPSDGGKYQPIESAKSAGFTVFSHLSITADKTMFAIAAGPKRSSSVIKVDLDTLELSVIRETRDAAELARLDIAVGELISFQSDGVEIQGYYYPPTNTQYRAESGELPPVVFFAHPGPTMQTTDALDVKKQYFTSKGFAVFDINYRGSTGRGRAFRNLLLGNWGIVDTNDIINAAKHLVATKRADPKKLCIIGSSAGGFLVLSALCHPESSFAAAVSIYGVADLEDIVKATHKFEADYTVKLVAPYPEGAVEYRRRSPFHNIDKIRAPVAFIHGKDDPVVSYTQSVASFEALKSKGITTALKLFPGESHGFRSAEAVTKSMDMSYAFFCRVLGIQSSVESEIEIVN